MIEENAEPGAQTPMRRQRLERIATAERDRRAGRLEVARAAIGEATEWPARVVLALAALGADELGEARRLLEQGLDRWAEEAGLEALDAAEQPNESDAGLARAPVRELAIPGDPAPVREFAIPDDPAPVRGLTIPGDPAPVRDAVLAAAPGADERLDLPLGSDELDRAFAEAEAQIDEMHDVNRVAERVLLDEPFGLAEISDEAGAVELPRVEVAIDAPLAALPLDAASLEQPEPAARASAAESDVVYGDGRGRDARVLATLERWLQNIERRRAGRA